MELEEISKWISDQIEKELTKLFEPNSMQTYTNNDTFNIEDFKKLSDTIKVIYPKGIKRIKFRKSYFEKWKSTLILVTDYTYSCIYGGIPYTVVNDDEISKDYIVIYNDGTER